MTGLSPLAKLVLLIALVLSLLFFFTLLGILFLLPEYGPGIIEKIANPDYGDPVFVNHLKLLQILNMAGGLLLPSLLFVFITEVKPAEYLNIYPRKLWMPVIIAAIFILFAQPVIGLSNELNSYLRLPEVFSSIEEWMFRTEQQATELTEAFLATTSYEGLMINVFMIAILPAISEEILFRGVLAQLFREMTKSIHWAVLLSSLLFAAIHIQFYGFLPRFLLGMAFGYIFFSTGNLWVPVMAHFINNLFAVLVTFLEQKSIIEIDAENLSSGNLVILSISIAVAGFLLYILLRKQDGGNPGKVFH